jgi:hypothetical protein
VIKAELHGVGPVKLIVNPLTYQYKGGGDAAGVAVCLYFPTTGQQRAFLLLKEEDARQLGAAVDAALAMREDRSIEPEHLTPTPRLVCVEQQLDLAERGLDGLAVVLPAPPAGVGALSHIEIAPQADGTLLARAYYAKEAS